MNKVKEIISAVEWFTSGMLGGDKYQKYLAHHRQTGCDHAPMNEREFWRDYHRRLDANPGARCC